MADKETPQGFAARKATEEDDVEGHAFARSKVTEGFAARKATEEDDVEGHAFGKLRSPSSKGE